MKLWWAFTDSNRGPTGYEPVALTAELKAQTAFGEKVATAQRLYIVYHFR